MLAVCVLVSLATILCVWRFLWGRSRYVRLLNRIPGSKGWPIIGNSLELQVNLAEFLQLVHREWSSKYGNIYRGWAGTRSVVCIASPELMEPILNSQELITKAQEYSYLSQWLGSSMFLTTGSRWKCRRRLLTSAFHFQILESFIDIFNEQSALLVNDFIDADRQNPHGDVNVYSILTQSALDIICDSSMGRQVRKREQAADYLRCVSRITQIVMERAVKPWLHSDFLFNLSGLGRENRRCVKILHDFTNQVIRDRKSALGGAETSLTSVDDVPQKRRLAFLDLLIQASENGAKLSDEDIREEVDTFMFAGHDTTATAMGWFLYCVARHPQEQQLLSDEMDDIFGDSQRMCTTQDVSRMKHLECCIKETLRLYPSIPGVMRTLTREVQIGEYRLPAGVSVALLIYGMHHNPSVYAEPEAFRPERFVAEHSAGRHPYAFIPFSAGPRNCIGQKYAILELKVVLSHLIRKFVFSVADGRKRIDAASEIVLKPVDGINLIVTARSG